MARQKRRLMTKCWQTRLGCDTPCRSDGNRRLSYLINMSVVDIIEQVVKFDLDREDAGF